jgi:hypothetical protein
MHELSDVLRTIWSKQTNGTKPYFFISTKRVSDNKWQDHFFQWPNLSKLDELLGKYKTDDYNLYFCPLPFERPFRRREFVMGSAMLWADIDEADPKKMSIPPHILWESSPGRWAGLWITERWMDVKECEDYNKRMTYGVGADPAGWDLTQVLRIPGTRNHKYKNSPWGQLTRITFKERVSFKDIPKIGEVSKTSAGKALEIYKKYEKSLRGETRSILTSKEATEGKRSEVLWKLYHQLFDAGVGLDEIKTLIKESVWNKFKGRRDEDKQINRDIEKCLGEKLNESSSNRRSSGGEGRGSLAGAEEIYEGISADTVICEKVDWLWWPYISRGALTIVEGDPGLGKSYFMQMVCSAIVDGGRLPSDGGVSGFEKIKRGGVFYFSVEDDPATVIVPRLRSNNTKKLSEFRIYDRKLTMDEEGLKVAEFLVSKHEVDLVVFDTLNYFVGGIDVHRANEVSQQMEHFTRLAKNHNVGVVVLRHLTKNSSGAVKGIYRGQGSIAFTGTAREVLTVGIHPEEHDLRIVAVTKLNLDALPKAVGYKILRNPDGSSRFEWSECLFDLTSDEIIDVRATGKKGRTKDDRAAAEAFLTERLSDGAMESGAIEGLAEAAGIPKATLRRVRDEMGIVMNKRSGGFYWKLPC